MTIHIKYLYLFQKQEINTKLSSSWDHAAN